MNFKQFLIESKKIPLGSPGSENSIITLVPPESKVQEFKEQGLFSDSKNILRFKEFNKDIHGTEELILEPGSDFVIIQNLYNWKMFKITGTKKNLIKMMKPGGKGLKGAGSTPLKEYTALWLLQLYLSNKDYSEESVLKFVDNNIEVRNTYSRIYYTNTLPAVKFLKEMKVTGAYLIQRPDGKSGNELVQKIYNRAKKLHADNSIGGTKAPLKFKDDNWNPGDIWLFNSNGVKEVDRICKMDNLIDFNQAINDAAKMRFIIPLSLKFPDKGISKWSVKIPDIITTSEPYDDNKYKFQKINIAITVPSHISTINVFSEAGWELYFQAQTPSKAAVKPWKDKAKTIPNPNYVPNLGFNIVVRNAKANHAGGSTMSQREWMENIYYIAKGWNKPIYRTPKISGITSEVPKEIKKSEYNKALKVIKKYCYADKGFSGTEFENVWPGFRQQVVMWASWVDFIYNNYEEIFKTTYLIGKKEGGYADKGGLSKNSFTTHFVIENEQNDFFSMFEFI